MTDTVHLGDGLYVSPQGYGGMSLTDVYGTITDDDALTTLTAAVDAGVTFIDTANVYGDGRSETTIAKLLKTRRDEVQLATKVGIQTGGGIGRREPRGDRDYIHEQIDLSLGRLGVDSVDLYYLHRVDPNTPIEDSVGAIAELIQAGKVRHIGLSEATGDELRRAASVHPIAAIQTEWSIISRDVEPGVVPAARELGIGFVPYSPLGRAWLAGTVDAATFEPQDARPNFPRFSADNLRANEAVLAEVREIAAEAGITPAQLSLAWLYEKGRALDIVSVPIPGSRYVDRVLENAAALDIRLEPEHITRLDALADRVSGHRSFNPQWVSAGRE